MQYELYLDVQFASDLAMNLVLLLMTAKLLHVPVSWLRLACAAALGAMGDTGMLVLAVVTGWRGWTVVPVFLAAIMLRAACSIKGWKLWVKAVAVFYGTSFLLAGAMQYLNPGERQSFRWFVLSAAGAYVLLLLLYQLFLRYRRRDGYICTVRLYVQGQIYELKALLDSGNSLMDPWFHKPVNVVGQSALKGLREECMAEMKLHMIPYSSIGRENGVLPGIVIQKMVIEGPEGERTVEEPVLAVSRTEVSSDNRYQMILHEEYMHN